jgi:Rieske 2Fe-2S family protein
MTTEPQAAPVTLVQTLVRRAAGELPGPPGQTIEIPVSAYTCEQRFALERDQLFDKLPLVLGHETQIPEAGDSIVHDWMGLPLITIRDKSGTIGTFMNVCRHRGMRLVQDTGQTCIKSMVCPYHQWTYGLDGGLRNIPLKESFGNIDQSAMGLVKVPTEVRHGLIWVQATPGQTMDLDAHLTGLGADLDAFNFGQLHFCKQQVRDVDCNWKLIQDAFLDGYHVTRLHKNTVGPFFPDSMAESGRIGRHIRSAVARNEIFEAVGLPVAELDTRKHASFSYTIFPNAVLVLHPEYTSIISLFPKGPSKTVFAHTMLTPRLPESDKERDHFYRSFELIDQGVFQAEDIHVSEGAQKGLASGANSSLKFGGFEAAAADFHRILDEAVGESSDGCVAEP